MSNTFKKNKIPSLRQIWQPVADVIIPFYKKNRLQAVEISSLKAKNTDLQQQFSDTVAELTKKSITDSLTGLLNVRGFHLHSKEYLNILRRHKYKPISGREEGMHDLPPEKLKRQIDGRGIIIIDADKFKSVNDNHGHAVGDRVLKNIANLLKKEIRPGDEVFRIGGDEFLIILATDNAKGIKIFSRRLQNKLDSEHARRSANGEVSVTGTVGFSVVNKEGRSPITTAKQWADLIGYISKKRRYPNDNLRASLPQAPIRKMI